MKIKIRGKNTNTAMPEFQVPFEIFTIVAPEPVTEDLTIAGDFVADTVSTVGGFGIFGELEETQQEIATAALTDITFDAPGTPNYTPAVTDTNPFGFATEDDANTVLSVIANLQDRINEMEAALQAYGILA